MVHGVITRLLARAVSTACAVSFCALTGARAPGPDSTIWQPRGNPPRFDAGPCNDAEAAARSLLGASTAANGENSPEAAAASDALVGALLLNGKGAHTATRELAQRVVRTKEATSGPDAVELAPSLRNLANVLADEGEHPQTIALLQRSLALRERALGPSSLAVA